MFFRYQLGSDAILQNDRDHISTRKQREILQERNQCRLYFCSDFAMFDRGETDSINMSGRNIHTLYACSFWSHHNIAIEGNLVSCLSCRMSPIGLILMNVVSKSPWALGGAGLSVSPPSDCLSPLYLWPLFPWYSLPFPTSCTYCLFRNPTVHFLSLLLLYRVSYWRVRRIALLPHMLDGLTLLRTPASSCVSKSQAVRDPLTHSVFLFLSLYPVDLYNYTTIRTYLFLSI